MFFFTDSNGFSYDISSVCIKTDILASKLNEDSVALAKQIVAIIENRVFEAGEYSLEVKELADEVKEAFGENPFVSYDDYINQITLTNEISEGIRKAA